MQCKSILSLQIWCGLGVLLLSVAVRLPHLNQSLWYDEMTTLVDYVLQPWSKILAAGTGKYVPNNHVLHTFLAKVVYTSLCGRDAIPPHEAVLRLPAFVGGSLVPIALVWPLRRSEPMLALVLAVVAALHPWLVAFSVEARGYSLLLLLGILATNCIAKHGVNGGTPRDPRSSIFHPQSSIFLFGYTATIALAIYTVPLAVLLIPAHATCVLILRRDDFLRWCISAAVAIALAGAMYAPMYRGLISYYSHPYPPTLDYRQFLDRLPRYAMAGVRLPTNANPLAPPATGAIFWVLPTLAIIFGSMLGWSRVALRPLLITFGGATFFGMLLALVDAGATEVRFVPWISLWFCLAIVALFFASPTRVGKLAGVLGIVTLISWQMVQDLTMPPNQPIREGIALADKMVPPNRDILVLYLGARESIALYGNTRHELLAGPDMAWMDAMQRRAVIETGHLPWMVIYFEQLARDRDLGASETRGMWRRLMTGYHLAAPRLQARLAPVAIYAPNEARRP